MWFFKTINLVLRLYKEWSKNEIMFIMSGKKKGESFLWCSSFINRNPINNTMLPLTVSIKNLEQLVKDIPDAKDELKQIVLDEMRVLIDIVEEL